MSKLRPGLVDAKPDTPSPKGATAYLLIHAAVEQASGLIHGKLDDEADCEHCAVGCYFAVEGAGKRALYSAIIDEVALVNDSVPTYTKAERRAFVLKWLRWKLAQLGMPQRGRPTKTEPKG